MTSILNFKSIVDLPKWRMLAATPASGSPLSICCDLRNNEDRHPYIFISNQRYSVKTDEWISSSLGLGNASAFFMPSWGPRGTLAAGATTTSVILTTVLPATVIPNQLANRGDGVGFKIRIIGNSVGGSGKIEERYITGNTAGTTPTMTLDTPLSFVPAIGDGYEFLSGRAYSMVQTSGAWSYIDIATNSASGALATPAAAGTSIELTGLDELFVPYDKNPGEGFLGILTATGSGAASLTGQVVGGDASVLANEYRNFQIRIIQDIATPTAVGQRRNITSHTAGPSSIYTVSAWTVTPSTTAQYVIENNDNIIIMWSSANTNTYTYSISGNVWDTNVTFAAKGSSVFQGACTSQTFGIEPDVGKNARHSFIYGFRGQTGTNNNLDLLDIAGAATGTWSLDINYVNKSPTLIQTTSSMYEPSTNQGRYMYIHAGGTTDFYRFDVKNRVLEPMTHLRAISGSPNNQCKQLATSIFVDGNIKIAFLYFMDTTSGLSSNPTYCLPIIR